MKNFIKSNIELFGAAALILADQLSKLFFDGKTIVVLQNVFSFKSVHNTGAAFSFLRNHTVLLIIISLIFLTAFLLFHKAQKKKTKLYRFAFAFGFAGAIGNLIDRIFLGYVRDFLSADFINFPIFNVADICLNVGVALFAIWIIKCEIKQNDKTKIMKNNK
ncbi:MAG: signal peptidase II [Clostridia bacterium]